MPGLGRGLGATSVVRASPGTGVTIVTLGDLTSCRRPSDLTPGGLSQARLPRWVPKGRFRQQVHSWLS